MELTGEEQRLLGAVLGHLMGPAGGFPEVHPFRMAHEAARSAIGRLQGRRLLIPHVNRYRLTFDGLRALNTLQARAVLAACALQIEPLRKAFREQPSRTWSADEFARATAQNPLVVARALAFLSDESLFVTYVPNSLGLASEFRVSESVLDFAIELPREGPSSFRLVELQLTDFRGFKQLNLPLQSAVTVVVGVNGAGKSSVLDSLAILLSQVPAAIQSRHSRGRRLQDSDIRNDANNARVAVSANIGGQSLEWSLTATRRGTPQEHHSNLASLKPMAASFQEANARGDVRLPLAVFYPVSRAPQVPSRIRERHVFDALAAFDQALEGVGRNFRIFFEWFREREDLENEQRVRERNFRDPQLESVRNAVERTVPGFSGLRVQRAPQRMIVEKEGGVLEIDQLSEGEKALLALVGDLARRLAIANPAAPDALLAPAVVLIDEVELHLHPGWQRVVIERLVTTFPNCQFVISTHSPQVLSGVAAESVVLLKRFELTRSPVQTLGRDSNSLLAEVMGVPERPPHSEERLQGVAVLIEEGKLVEAKSAVDDLARQFGNADHEVVRLSSLLGFLE